MPIYRWFAAGYLAILMGCGSGGGSDSPSPGNTGPNALPVAQFISAASVVEGNPLSLDASSSSDSDGDVLTFSWNFGDGRLGGGAKLAHVYTSAGKHTVTLTVDDGKGGQSSATQEIEVTSGIVAGAVANTKVEVVDNSGPLSGVIVTEVGTTNSAATDATGIAEIATPTGVPIRLKLSKVGYSDQFKTLTVPTGATDSYLDVLMQARDTPLTLVSAAAGGKLVARDGALVDIPANSLVGEDGKAVTGAVQVTVTPVDVANNVDAFPGLFQGLQADGKRGLIASHGTVEYVLTQGGKSVQLAPGKKATIEIPIYTGLGFDGSPLKMGDVVPLWSLDEHTSTWIQEGVGTVVPNSLSPTEIALRAEVGHFSWWNNDQWVGLIPDESYNSDLECCIRDTPGGACKENSGHICSHRGKVQGAGASLKPQFAYAGAKLRNPALEAWISGPASGITLPLPADTDVLVESTAINGTYIGSAMLRGGAGVHEKVVINVEPISSGNGNVLSLPWNKTYSIGFVGAKNVYTLPLAVGAGFELKVSQYDNSNLEGVVKLIRPNGEVVGNATLNSTAANLSETTVSASGNYKIEITATKNAPGGFRLELYGYASCSTTETLTLPYNASIALAANQARCFDFDLAQGDVVQITPSQVQNGISGAISFATEEGLLQLASRNYPATTRILAGVANAGTYRFRVVNYSSKSGSLKVDIAQKQATPLAANSSTVLDNLVAGQPNLYVLIPPSGGLMDVMVQATGLNTNVSIEPMLAGFSIGSSSGSSTQTSARAVRVTPPVLPVVVLTKAGGSAASNSVTLSSGKPTLIAKDSDVNGIVGETPLVYAFEGMAGDTMAYGKAVPELATNSGKSARLEVFAPSGNADNTSNPVKTLSENGIYTVLVSRLTGVESPFTVRVNNVPPPEPLSLTSPLTSKLVNLPLGQVLRYNVSLEQGELVGLGLRTAGSFNLQASLAGVYNAAIDTPTSGSGPFAAATPPRFVISTQTDILTLRSTSVITERASGEATVDIIKPVPTNGFVNQSNAGFLDMQEWTSFRYALTAGRYLLRVSSTSVPSTFYATLWAANSNTTFYEGELTSNWTTYSVNDDNVKQLAAGDYTLSVRNGLVLAGDNKPYSTILVALDDPSALIPNAAQTAGKIEVDGERDYYTFAGTAGQSYTLHLTTQFAGKVLVKKLAANGDWTTRDFNYYLASTPLDVENGVEKNVTITIPDTIQFGTGTYVIEVYGAGDATGNYSIKVTQ